MSGNPAPEKVAALRLLAECALDGVGWSESQRLRWPEVTTPAAILELLDELDRLRAAAGYDVARTEEGETFYEKALRAIADMDYRGNRSRESEIARAALAASDEAVRP